MIEVGLLDLDGCLVNFVKGAMELHKVEVKPREVIYDFWKQMGLEANAFWSPLGRDFWANLEWTVEGEALLKMLEDRFKDNLFILSSPCETDGCLQGKYDWVKKHMPKYRRKCFFGASKFAFASERHLLIDDMDYNCDKFYDAGGSVITVPRPWNRFVNDVDNHGNFNLDKFYGRLCDTLRNSTCTTA